MSDQTKNYASHRSSSLGSVRLAAIVLPMIISVVVLLGCGENPPSVITALDGTFSDQKVAAQCLPELDRAADIAAERGGSFTFFAYDGDPLSRRGISIDFGDQAIPNRLKGTEKEGEYRVEQAGPILNEMHKLASDRPTVGGTSLLGVLTRIARIAKGLGSVPTYVVNCGDGLWTDLRPGMSDREVQGLAREIPVGMEGMTIDFVGLSVSAPGSGHWVERLRPLVKQILEDKQAHLGVYDVELPADWPQGS